MTSRRYAAALVGVVALAGLSCIQDFVSAPTATSSGRSYVAVRPPGAVLNGPGSTYRFAAEALDAQGFVLTGEPIVWSSLNPAVATVDSLSGLVQAVASGQAIVTARAQSLQPTAVVVTVTAEGGAGVDLLRADSTGGDADIAAIWGASPAAVYAAGSGGTLLWRSGGRWVPVETGVRQDLNDVWGTTADTVWAVGTGGTVLRCAARLCTSETVPTAVALSGLWGSAPDSLVVVGAAGSILRPAMMPNVAPGGGPGTWNRVWRPDSSGTRQHLRAVWGAASDDIFAVGDAGTILHYDGQAWSPMASGVGVALLSVWGAGPDQVFAVGDGGVVLLYDGHAWTSLPSGTGALLSDVWGTGPADVYAVGAGATLLRWDGTHLSALAGPGGAGDLSAIWGTSAGAVYVGGPGGALHRGALDEAARLVFATPPPASVHAGEPFGLEVRAVTGRGATDTGFRDTVRLTLGRAPSGATLHGTLTVVADGGRAVFTDLWLDKAASGYTLRAAAPGLAAGETRSFILRRGPASRLRFTTQPADTVAGNALAPVRASLTDDYGNVVDSAVNVVIRLALPEGASSPLQGTLLRNTVQGTATFDDLVVPQAGTTHRFVVQAQGLANDTSARFAIRPGPVDTLVVAPVGASLAGAGATQTLAVTGAFDRYGNILPVPAGLTWSSLNPRVATVDPATGVATASGVGQVTVAVTSGSVVDYALLTVTLPAVPVVTTWTTLPSPTTEHLWGIWGASESAVYAVGNNGMLVRFDGSSWTAQQVALPGTTLRAVWGYAPEHFTVVGDSGFAVSLANGVRTAYPPWKCDGQLVSNTAVWGTSPRHVQMAGVGNAAVSKETSSHSDVTATGWLCTSAWFDGQLAAAISPFSRSTDNSFLTWYAGLWGTSPSDVWLGGAVDGMWYGTATFPVWIRNSCNSCHSGWAASATQGFAGNSAGRLVRRTGDTWTTLPGGGNSRPLMAVWGTSATDVYAVGAGGTIMHWDGATMTRLNSGTTEDLLGIWGTENVVYVVGANGTILRGTH